ncbi:MAG: UDP-glucose/GDP-mannose dehydrogenase family protein [Oxalobacteraceae bacterium]|nr:MAG: UDP-glucose/GDP-mannose dehydrogenase family protein [Oxalobacteraceae bacterium]
MRISVFGIGYVGAVSCGCLASAGHEVVGVDVSPDKVDMLARGQSPIVEDAIDTLIADAVAHGKLRATMDVAGAVRDTEVSFISVGTPSGPDGSVSLRAVDEVIATIGTALRDKPGTHVVVMRSTVPPGTAEDRVIPALEHHSGKRHGEGFRYYSNPEFLREGSSVKDFHAPPYTLIGAAAGDDAAAVREIYQGVSGEVHVAPFRVAESVKMLANAYHAVKLAFANEGGAILSALGVDARAAYKLFCEDRVLNISSAYLTPGFAFGGSCLPKDMRSLLALADHAHVPAPFLKSVLPSNQTLIDGTFEAIAKHGRQRVALFGLAFKQGTDDLRESPFVVLAEKLIGKGYDVSIFDRSVQIARLTGSNRAYIEREIPHLERLLAAEPADALAGAKLVVVGHVAKADRPALLAALDGQHVLDLGGIPELREHGGITYQGLCW